MYEIVLFDFDFTLADASAGIIEGAQFAAREMGIRVPDPEEIRRTIGMTLTGTYAAFTGDTDVLRAKEFAKLFVSKADEVMTKNTRFFPGRTGQFGTAASARCPHRDCDK